MTFFSIGPRTYGDIDNLLAALKEADKSFPGKWGKTLGDSADIALKYMLRQFGTAGAEFGTPWKQLAPATQEDRRRKGYKPKRPILVRRGWLRASLTSKTSANIVIKISSRGIIMMSVLKTKTGHNLFELHQKGGGKLPPRKMTKEGSPPFISEKGWKEIETRMVGMFFEIRREMERR